MNWYCLELPLTDYETARKLQIDLVSARKDRRLESNIVLLLEHPPVFTLGRRGGLENLTVSQAFLQRMGISVIPAERGGNITFHGPGQMVSYLIIDLHSARLSVTEYVEKLEEVMIQTAADFGVCAERNAMNRGVWVGNSKLGSIGIAVRRGISFHGFAFNVNVSPEPFEWINPCGLHGVGVTTLARELGGNVSMSSVRDKIKQHIENAFRIKLETASDVGEICSSAPGQEVNF
jgi:lipoate-protein ligase B